MKIRHCPRCRCHCLFQTGAFWACATCRYAITQSALMVDEGRPSKPQPISFASPSTL